MVFELLCLSRDCPFTCEFGHIPSCVFKTFSPVFIFFFFSVSSFFFLFNSSFYLCCTFVLIQMSTVWSHVTWFLSLFFWLYIYIKSLSFSISSDHFLTSYSLMKQNQLDYLLDYYIPQTFETVVKIPSILHSMELVPPPPPDFFFVAVTNHLLIFLPIENILHFEVDFFFILFCP